MTAWKHILGLLDYSFSKYIPHRVFVFYLFFFIQYTFKTSHLSHLETVE